MFFCCSYDLFCFVDERNYIFVVVDGLIELDFKVDSV